MIIELKSVGCVFDTTNKTIYPKYQMGGYDILGGVELDKLDKHFIDEMSEEDILKINESIPTYVNGKLYNPLKN
mgnify:FL=1